MNKILVTRQIPQHYIEQLKKIGQVVMWEHDLESHFLLTLKMQQHV